MNPVHAWRSMHIGKSVLDVTYYICFYCSKPKPSSENRKKRSDITIQRLTNQNGKLTSLLELLRETLNPIIVCQRVKGGNSIRCDISDESLLQF